MVLKWLFFSKKIARIAQRLEASPLGPIHASCSQCQKGSKYHPNGVKMAVFFQKKNARIAQQLRALPPGPHYHFVQNVKTFKMSSK